MNIFRKRSSQISETKKEENTFELECLRIPGTEKIMDESLRKIRGDRLAAEFERTVHSINDHSNEIGKYCECGQCEDNRRKLNDLSQQMIDIGYQRKAMF